MNFSRSAEEMAESIYLIDISNNQLEQHFADDRTITTPMGNGVGKTSALSWIGSRHHPLSPRPTSRTRVTNALTTRLSTQAKKNPAGEGWVSIKLRLVF